MNFKKRVNGSWHDIPHYVHKTDTDAITTLPTVIYPTDTMATVGLKGQTIQSSTPSPTSPVMPQGTGERTGNLFDYNAYFDSVFTPYNEFFNYAEIQLQPNTTYALSTSIKEIGHNLRNTAFIVATSNETPTTARGGISNVSPITKTTESDGILKLYKRTSGIGVMPTKRLFDAGDWLMLNTGSTPLPYEPWGIKIPISSASTTTPVYLGEAESTRQIKKLVLTGEENITSSHLNVDLFNVPINDYLRAPILSSMCTHYKAIQNVSEWGRVPDKNTCFYIGADGDFRQLYIRDSSYSTISDFKAYLAAQYAAGTPVTVWYVLASPTTGIVNEPIRKIGDYADTVSGITIPTIAGADSFDVLTTLKPSEVTVNYHGWHTGAVHERENGAWT